MSASGAQIYLDYNATAPLRPEALEAIGGGGSKTPGKT